MQIFIPRPLFSCPQCKEKNKQIDKNLQDTYKKSQTLKAKTKIEKALPQVIVKGQLKVGAERLFCHA